MGKSLTSFIITVPEPVLVEQHQEAPRIDAGKQIKQFNAAGLSLNSCDFPVLKIVLKKIKSYKIKRVLPEVEGI